MKRIYLIVLAATFISASAILSANAQQATPYQVEYQTPQNYKDFRFPLAVVMLSIGESAKTGDSKIDDMNKKITSRFHC